MNGRRAKRLRKKVYGDEYSPRHRIYVTDPKTGTRHADGHRKVYQKMKRAKRDV